jgi:hypothetical protein
MSQFTHSDLIYLLCPTTARTSNAINDIKVGKLRNRFRGRAFGLDLHEVKILTEQFTKVIIIYYSLFIYRGNVGSLNNCWSH